MYGENDPFALRVFPISRRGRLGLVGLRQPRPVAGVIHASRPRTARRTLRSEVIVAQHHPQGRSFAT